MAGLSIGIGGGRSLGGGSGMGQSSAATIAQTNYGAGSSAVTAGGGLQTWHVFTGVQIAALTWLMFIRWSLPSGRSRGAA